jgi:site-specific DNA-methyltransferase (adenine-specific)
MAAVTELDSIQHADIFALCDQLDAASVDMILCDLPYGTTACSWDTVIPFAPMWERFKRVIKPRGAIVLTASQPFTSALVMSNPTMFKYSWVWDKVQAVGHLNSKIMPMKRHEDIVVFGQEMPAYYPQMTARKQQRIDKPRTAIYGVSGDAYGSHHKNYQAVYDAYCPDTFLKFQNGDQSDKVHPTQKPVALFRYLIRTYTQPGDVVLDPTCGSGTTALAAREEQRHYICGDSSAEYVAVAQKRMDAPYTLPLFQAQ